MGCKEREPRVPSRSSIPPDPAPLAPLWPAGSESQGPAERERETGRGGLGCGWGRERVWTPGNEKVGERGGQERARSAGGAGPPRQARFGGRVSACLAPPARVRGATAPPSVRWRGTAVRGLVWPQKSGGANGTEPQGKPWRQANAQVGPVVVDRLLNKTGHSFHPQSTRHMTLDESYPRSTENILLKLNNLPWLPMGLCIKLKFPSLTLKTFPKPSFKLHLLPSTLHILPPITLPE